jgi:hypothetical protein
MATNKRDRFCDECDVSLDLHPGMKPGDFECDVARSKAELLDKFDRVLGLRP